MSKTGIALAGCGEIAALHAKALERSGMARIVAVYDLQIERACDFAAGYGARLAENLDDLLADPAVEAVYVLTRHDSHASIVLRCLEKGKHVFCEKPLALTLVDAQKISDQAGKSGKYLMVGFNHRWEPAVSRAAELVRSIAKPCLSMHISFATGPFLHTWAGLEEEGGGIWPCLGSHAIDLACHLSGEVPVMVAARACRLRLESPYLEDTAAVILQMASGALCTMNFHDHAPVSYVKYATGERSHLVRTEIFGDGWAVLINDSHQVRLFDGSRCQVFSFKTTDSLELLGILPEDIHFVRCIQAGVPPQPDVADGVRAVHLVSLASLSAATNSIQEVGSILR